MSVSHAPDIAAVSLPTCSCTTKMLNHTLPDCLLYTSSHGQQPAKLPFLLAPRWESAWQPDASWPASAVALCPPCFLMCWRNQTVSLLAALYNRCLTPGDSQNDVGGDIVVDIDKTATVPTDCT